MFLSWWSPTCAVCSHSARRRFRRRHSTLCKCVYSSSCNRCTHCYGRGGLLGWKWKRESLKEVWNEKVIGSTEKIRCEWLILAKQSAIFLIFLEFCGEWPEFCCTSIEKTVGSHIGSCMVTGRWWGLNQSREHVKCEMLAVSSREQQRALTNIIEHFRASDGTKKNEIELFPPSPRLTSSDTFHRQTSLFALSQEVTPNLQPSSHPLYLANTSWAKKLSISPRALELH
jgi:hypothetical protein